MKPENLVKEQRGVQCEQSEDARLPSGALGEVAGWGRGAEWRAWLGKGGSGAGLAGVMVCSDRLISRWPWDIREAKAQSAVTCPGS